MSCYYLVAVLSLAYLVAGSTSEACLVVGHAVDSRTGQALARVEVELAALVAEQRQPGKAGRSDTSSNPSGQVSRYAALSDEKGVFRFPSVRPGQYVLVGRKPGFLLSPYRASSPSHMSAILKLRAGETAEVSLRLIPQSIVSGKVADENGDPLDVGNVQLLSEFWQEGQLHHVVQKTVILNDLGEYRIAGLPAGNYLLKFQPREIAVNPDMRRRADRVTASQSVPTYHTNVISVRDAKPVIVGQGETLSGVDITVRRARTYTVEGVLRAADRTPEFASLTLVPAGEEIPALMGGNNVLGTDGTFRFPGVPAGDYNLYFVAGMGNGVSAGSLPVRVTDRDVAGLKLEAVAPVTISGDVRFENADSESIENGKIRIRSADLMIGPSYDATFERSGSFELKDCSPGLYAVDVTPPGGFYVKTIRYGGLDAANVPITVNRPGTKLEVVLRRGAARLRGRPSVVRNDDGKLRGGGDHIELGAYFAIVPQDRQSSKPNVRFGYCDEDGGFEVDGLAPGVYRVFALTSPDPSLFRKPDVLSELQASGAEVTLAEGEVATVVAPVLDDAEGVRLGSQVR